jgi:two-component sensor histidine kinase
MVNMEAAATDQKYLLLFNNSNIAILEEDFSAVFSALEKIPVRNSDEMHSWLENHPRQVFELFTMVQMVDVNPAALRLFEAEDKQHFLGSLSRIIDDRALPFLIDELTAFYNKERVFEGETVNHTLSGRPIDLLISISFPGDQGMEGKAVVTIVDISERKHREREAEGRRLLSETIQDITMEITGEVDRDRLLALILQQVRRVVDFTSGSIKLFRDGKLKVERSLGYKERGILGFMVNHEIDPDNFPLVKATLESKEPLIVGDTLTHPEWISYPETSYIRSVIFIPLLQENTVIGEIVLEHELPNTYTVEDGDKLKPFASAVSLALKNSTLYQQLRDTARQREILLKELHHRVKNNLALVNSLVNLHFDRSPEPSTEEILRQIQRKIASIVMVHEKLYAGDDLQYIMLGDYLHDLLQELAYGTEQQTAVEVVDDIDPSLQYPIEVLIPLGLIVSELYTNSIKHAVIPDTETLRFFITVTIDEKNASFFIGDNGQGFPDNLSFSDPILNSSGIGLSLVESLAKQIGGSASLVPGPGGGVGMTIPLSSRD